MRMLLCVAIVLVAGCSTVEPEVAAARQVCDVLEPWAVAEEAVDISEDATSYADVDEVMDQVELGARADGLSMVRVEANIERECPDAVALWMEANEQLREVLEDILGRIDDDG